jgi:hypothetical protein
VAETKRQKTRNAIFLAFFLRWVGIAFVLLVVRTRRSKLQSIPRLPTILSSARPGITLQRVNSVFRLWARARSLARVVVISRNSISLHPFIHVPPPLARLLSLSLPLSLRCLSVCKPRESSVVGALLRFVGASGSFVAEEGPRLHGRKRNRYDVARDGGSKASATCLCIIACFATAYTTTTTSSPVCFSGCHSSSRDAMDPNQGSFEESRWWWRRRW